ncbi:MAG TPA: hypothetical protein VG672_10355, partial [Bryobacteraceae bacterium]|nr:hypothetical protein [Bryobacteraceae bacterium]
MAAFFRNTTQPVMDGNSPDTPPMVVVPAVADRQSWSDLLAREADLKQRMQSRHTAENAVFDQWLGSSERVSLQMPLEPAAQVLSLDFRDELKLSTGGGTIGLALPEGATLGPGNLPERQALHFGKES